MSVTMTKSEGVTVFSMTSKPRSKWPLICQMLGTLCYSPICSGSQILRRLQDSSQSALGTIQIMVGLLNLGMGPILLSYSTSWGLREAPYWLGGVFIAVGIMCILTEKFPSVCLVGINVLANLVGVGLAITAIVKYARALGLIKYGYNRFTQYCRENWNWRRHQPTPYPTIINERCLEAKEMAVGLLKGLVIVLIVLAVLQLCVTISSVVLSIKALYKNQKEGKENTQDVELYNPLLEDTTTNPTAAAAATDHDHVLLSLET